MPVMLTNNQTAQPNQWVRIEVINYNTHTTHSLVFLTQLLPNNQLHPFNDLLQCIKWERATPINCQSINKHDTLILYDNKHDRYIVRECNNHPKQLTLFNM